MKGNKINFLLNLCISPPVYLLNTLFQKGLGMAYKDTKYETAYMNGKDIRTTNIAAKKNLVMRESKDATKTS